jgi:hypothetical protein
MNSIEFAIIMETSVRQEFENVRREAPAELLPLLNLLLTLQTEYILLLEKAQIINGNTGNYPQPDDTALISSEADWQELVSAFAAVSPKQPLALTTLWMICALSEKSSQFYQQAATNTPYQTTRLFLSSLAQIKNMLKRRINGVMRIMHNDVWGEVGFAPFLLGKD